MNELQRSNSTGPIDNTPLGETTSQNTVSHVETQHSPTPWNLIQRILHPSAPNSTPSIDTISNASSFAEKIDALKQVKTTMLVLVKSIAEAITPNDTDRRSLGQLVTTLSGKLRTGDMSGTSILGTSAPEKTVRCLLSVLDPVALKSLSSSTVRTFTIAPQLKQVEGNYGRFGLLCQRLITPEHRATALADLAHTWLRDAVTCNFAVDKAHKGAVASCLVDFLREENWSNLIRPTEEQAFDVAACLIQEVLRPSVQKTYVDPNRTITIRAKYNMPAPYINGPRRTDKVGHPLLPEYVLEAISNITRCLPTGDSRRNELANRLRAVPVPEDAPYCTSSADEENDHFINGLPDKPVIPKDAIDTYNSRLHDVRNEFDKLHHVLLTAHPPIYSPQNPPSYSGNAS